MTDPLPIAALKRELTAAGEGLLGNDDLLRGVLSGCGDCIKVLDLEGRLQFMSEGGKRVMEVDDFSILKGCPWPDLWQDEGNDHARAAIATAKAGSIARFRSTANTAKGTPRFWDVQVSPILGPDGKPSHLLSISRDITEECRLEQVQQVALEHQKFLTAELTHRVKNTLATVLAIANQTFRDEAHKVPRDIFSGRIKTLSDAYNILTEAAWSAGSIPSITQSALAPYRSGTSRFTVSGPEYTVSPSQALTLALALNELATNAMKYGALSSPSGRIAVTWSLEEAGLHFEWRESGGPVVTPPTRTGFGTRLIKMMLAGDFGGKVELKYEPDGLVCVLTAPLMQTP